MSIFVFKYFRFVFNIVFRKISIFILFILILVFLLIIGLVYKFVVGENYYLFLVYIFIFISVLVIVIFLFIKVLNIFKDFDSEGLEIIILFKFIFRNNLILGKLLVLIYFGFLWLIIMFVAVLFGFYVVYEIK